MRIRSPYSNWGRVLSEQKKYNEAIGEFQKAIAVDPKYAPAYSNWGDVLREQNKYDQAAAKYRKAIDLDPKYAAANNNWGL
jgi:superkiller protein 3